MNFCIVCDAIVPATKPDKTQPSIRFEKENKDGTIEFSYYYYSTVEAPTMCYLHSKMLAGLLKPVISERDSAFKRWEKTAGRSKARFSDQFAELAQRIFRIPKTLGSSS